MYHFRQLAASEEVETLGPGTALYRALTEQAAAIHNTSKPRALRATVHIQLEMMRPLRVPSRSHGPKCRGACRSAVGSQVKTTRESLAMAATKGTPSGLSKAIKDGGRRFQEHRRADDVGRQGRVGLGVEDEPLRAHLREERVLDHLHEPDHPDHEKPRRQVGEQDELHRAPSSFSAAASPESTAPSTFGPA